MGPILAPSTLLSRKTTDFILSYRGNRGRGGRNGLDKQVSDYRQGNAVTELVVVRSGWVGVWVVGAQAGGADGICGKESVV